jgi:tetratricopeptide (TPR) repeat protein
VSVRGGLVVLALVHAITACAPKGASTPGNEASRDAVRAEITAAEDAEAKRNHEVARTHYEAAVAAAHDPRSAGFAHREYGETLATWGENEAARTHLEASVAAVATDPMAWQMLGILRAKLGDTAGAFTALERSKQLAPRAWIPRRDLAVLHWTLAEGRTHDPDPAVAARHRAAALAEYKEMLDLDLPDRLREKVRWAIDVLSRPAATAQPGPS